MLEPFLGRSAFANHGLRVVKAQRLMQAASDTMLSWIHAKGIDSLERDLYVANTGLEGIGPGRGDAAEDDGDVCRDLLANPTPRTATNWLRFP